MYRTCITNNWVRQIYAMRVLEKMKFASLQCTCKHLNKSRKNSSKVSYFQLNSTYRPFWNQRFSLLWSSIPSQQFPWVHKLTNHKTGVLLYHSGFSTQLIYSNLSTVSTKNKLRIKYEKITSYLS